MNIMKAITALAGMMAAGCMSAGAQNAEKVAQLAEKDPHGLIASLTAASVVFLTLFILFICYKLVGKASNGKFSFKKTASNGKMTDETALAIAMALRMEQSSETEAAIAMALHCYMDGAVHDEESFVITINHTKSEWTSKQLTLRQLPARKPNR